MNPDVTDNITSSMSELQLQLLQHLKIHPLQSNLVAPDYQPALHAAVFTAPAGQDSVVVQSVPSEAFPPEPARLQWITADASLPLVQDMLIFLQQAGVHAQWFYQADTPDIQLTEAGLFSAPPQHFLAAAGKKQLWQSLIPLLPADISTDTEPT